MPKIPDHDTIAAIATAPGEGGIGIVRLSGARSIEIADTVFLSKSGQRVRDQKSFTVQYGRIPGVDEVLVLVMRAPKSYTREDVVEISAHGGQAVLNSILDSLVRQGARLAVRGEFTKRAFLNGRLDLVQAEAVMDLVKARTGLGEAWASARLEGALSGDVKRFKEALLHVLSHLEAAIDFPDDLLTPMSLQEIDAKLKQTEQAVRRLLVTARVGVLTRGGFHAVIAGRPNVGKSSLMNGLVRQNRAIVTPIPGTTRDVVHEEIELRGIPIRVSDTAGIQESSDLVEREGIERTKQAVRDSDLVLYVVDQSEPSNGADEMLFGSLADRSKILVANKADLLPKLDRRLLQSWAGAGVPVVETSCVREGGLEALEREIYRFITGGAAPEAEESVVGSLRQKDVLEKTLESLTRARRACQGKLGPELIAVDIREALDRLGELVGEVLTDEILDEIFNQFCVGK